MTTISGGILSTNNLANGSSASGIGQSSTTASNLVLNGGTLQYTGAVQGTNRNYTLGTSGGGIDASGSGALTISGNMTASGTTGTQTFTLTGTSTAANTVSGTINNGINSNKTILTKTGIGTWVLSGANTFTGGVNINGGVLNLGILQGTTTGPLGGSSGGIPTGLISFGGGTLQYSSVNATDYSSKFSTAANQAYSIDTNGRSVTFATALTSSGGTLTLNDTNGTPGTLTLTAAGTYTGNTTIMAGTLALSGSGSFANSPIIDVAPRDRLERCLI